jgi:hypothetical protein
LEIIVNTNPYLYVYVRVRLDGPLIPKLWRKLAKPPPPWKVIKNECNYRGTVTFSAYYKAAQPAPPTDWIEEYLLRLSLIQGPPYRR